MTLYEIFGFLLPGVVLFTGLVIVFWTVFYPHVPLTPGWFAHDAWLPAASVSYFLGHLAQALANYSIGPHPREEDLILPRSRTERLPDALVELAVSKTAETVGVPRSDMSLELALRICDEVVARNGNSEDREIYQYREGFYRGLTIASAVLGLSLFARAAIRGALLSLSGAAVPIGGAELCGLGLLSLVGSRLSFLRYRRFARYGATQALIGFLLSPRNDRTTAFKS